MYGEITKIVNEVVILKYPNVLVVVFSFFFFGNVFSLVFFFSNVYLTFRVLNFPGFRELCGFAVTRRLDNAQVFFLPIKLQLPIKTKHTANNKDLQNLLQ